MLLVWASNGHVLIDFLPLEHVIELAVALVAVLVSRPHLLQLQGFLRIVMPELRPHLHLIFAIVVIDRVLHISIIDVDLSIASVAATWLENGAADVASAFPRLLSPRVRHLRLPCVGPEIKTKHYITITANRKRDQIKEKFANHSVL